jgi:hypothetical protein
MESSMYLSPGTWVLFPRETKTPIVKRVGEDREVAVGTTYVGGARAVTAEAEGVVHDDVPGENAD